MKVLKKIVIVLAGIVGLAVLISFFLPSEVVVQRSTEINASAATVYAQVNNLKSWEAWDPWHAKEPEMGGSVYSGPEAGVDAKHCWDSENPDIGKGCLTIIESDENSSIKTMLEFDDHAPGYGNWSFEETDGVTSVTWAMNMDMGMNVIAKFMGLMMDGMLGPDFESGLAKLKEVAESIPVEEPPANLANAEYVKVESQPIYSIKDSTDTFGIGAKLGELYGELTAYLSELGIESTGQPLCIWHEWNPEGYSTLEAAIPVAETGEGKDRINAGEIAASNVVTATHVGHYSLSANTYMAIEDYIKDMGYMVIGPPWEVYVTDPGTEPDSTKWQTQIYFPVE